MANVNRGEAESNIPKQSAAEMDAQIVKPNTTEITPDFAGGKETGTF